MRSVLCLMGQTVRLIVAYVDSTTTYSQHLLNVRQWRFRDQQASATDLTSLFAVQDLSRLPAAGGQI